MAVKMAFVKQAAPDIKKKLHTLDGFEVKNLSEPEAIATKIYNNRETPEMSKLEDWQKH